MNMETMHFDGSGSNTGLRTLQSVMIDDRSAGASDAPGFSRMT